MGNHLLYELTAEELTQDSFQSELIDLLSKVLTGVRESLIHPTDDFERWDTKNLDVLYKILEEFKYNDLLNGQNFINTLLARPELLWTLTKLSANKSGLELFFKMFGVYDNLDATLPEKKTSFYDNRSSISSNSNDCNSVISVDSSRGLMDEGTLIAKLEAINIFTKLKMDMCQEVETLIELSSERKIFNVISYCNEIISFETKKVMFNNVGVTSTPVGLKGISNEVAYFETGSFYK